MVPFLNSSGRRSLVIAVAATAVLLAYIVVWLHVDAAQQLHADFLGAYQGATSLRMSGGAHLYDVANGLTTPEALALPSGHNGVAFFDAPPAAAIMLPFALLNVHAAWWAWSLLQLLSIAAAMIIMVSAAPWPQRDRSLRAAAALLGAAGVGTLVVLLQGQWSGVFALGVAAGYALMRRGRLAAGAAVALTPMFAVKPNLAIGLAAFMLGWGNRRVVVATVGCAAATAIASLAVAGVHGLAAFLSAVLRDTPVPSSNNGFSGLVASLLGSNGVTVAIALAGSLAAVVAAAALGRAARHRPQAFEPALAGALSLTLLASLHLYDHDLTLLAPALVLALASAAQLDRARGSTVPGRACGVVALLWLSVAALGARDFGASSVGFPGRVVPWFLLAFGVLAAVATLVWAKQLIPADGRRALPRTGRRAAPLESPPSARRRAGTMPHAPDAARGW